MNWSIGRVGRNAMLGLVATGMVLTASMPTQAQTQKQNDAAANAMLPGVTAKEIIGMLTKNQIQAQQAPLESNDPLILAMMPSGAKFFVRLQGCGEKGVNCQVIQYGAIFTGANLPANDFNIFNSRYTFGKAYEGPQNQMFIHHAVSVAGGIRRVAVEINMFVFFQMADFFTKFLAERMGSLQASADQPADSKSTAITNAGGELPVNPALASFREISSKHPGIINKVHKDSLKNWAMK